MGTQNALVKYTQFRLFDNVDWMRLRVVYFEKNEYFRV